MTLDTAREARMTTPELCTISGFCAEGRYDELAARLSEIPESADKRRLLAALFALAFDCGKLAQLREEFARLGAPKLVTRNGAFV